MKTNSKLNIPGGNDEEEGGLLLERGCESE